MNTEGIRRIASDVSGIKIACGLASGNVTILDTRSGNMLQLLRFFFFFFSQ
jgi:hypothetical protein